MARFLAIFATALVLASPTHADRQVVLVVCDGLRPDLVQPDVMPTLHQLAKQGVFFQHHHAVFVSATVVNGTAMATGCYPAKNGTCANVEYRADLEARTNVSTADPRVAGNLPVPTLAQILQQHGLHSAIVGSKSVALVHNAHPVAPSLTLFEDRGLPESLFQAIRQRTGLAPLASLARDDWSTRALIGPVWDRALPAFSLLWLCEPDFTQHDTGPGSEPSRKAMTNSDRNLARLLAELDARHVRDQTDVLVVSDHGFSTITAVGDVAGALQQHGFSAVRHFAAAPQANDILVVTSGGSTLLYVIGHDAALIKRAVAFLQQQSFSGVIFTRDRLPGTFPLAAARIDTAHPPDIVVAMRWGEATNTAGVPGSLTIDATRHGLGQGAHGSLSRYDLRATLIAAGPDFRRGMVDQLPSGNADVAPTVLTILGLPVPENMDGRPLVEALSTVTVTNLPAVVSDTREVAAELPAGVWHQYLRVSQFGKALYFDEGNGAFQARNKSQSSNH